ncbi:MAG: baseplate J/gp47 family protein [Candidatus Levyibacteriota bacterium]
MKISLPFLDKKETLSYFLVLVLRNNKASAVIFEETGGTVRVVNQASENFTDSIENVSEEEFLNVLDKAISKAESLLPENIETQKTIFGVKENWAEDSRIKKEYLAKLKKASDELDLVPIGFLITTEAIAHFLAKEEGAPISAILAEIDRNYVSASLIRAGKVVETKTAKLEGKASDTVDTLLKHFENVEVLPSRVIIFGADMDLTQDFISHSWSKTLPFLHLPQISNLEQGFDAKAVLSGAASEMGFQVLGETTSKPKTQSETKIEINEGFATKSIPDTSREDAGEEETTENTEDKSDSFGFVKEKDIAQGNTAASAASEQETEDSPTATAEAIAEIPQELQAEQSESKPLPANAAIILSGAKKVLGKVLGVTKRSASSVPAFSRGNKFIFLPLGFFFIFIALLILYFFGRSAVVTLNIDAKKISQTKDVTFSAGSPTDASKNIIAAQFVEITENGSVSTNATGKKDIGTPAKGTVTIFNQNLSPITVPANTTITSSNSIKFTTDKSVTVASASAKDEFSSTDPGTENVTVTAEDIGTNGNLPSNTKFSFSNASIAAKNDNPFSGGTQKSITVVSEKDIAKLEDDLVKNLEEKAKEDIVKKISGDKVLLPVFVSNALSKKDFSKKEGDEASQVTLKAEVNYKSVAYNKSDIVSFAKEAMKGDISNLDLNENSITTSVKEIKKTQGNDVSTSLEISGLLLPKIEQQNLVKEISGKSTKFAENLLTNISQVSSAIIKISPNIPLFPKNLPDEGKIRLEINSNE